MTDIEVHETVWIPMPDGTRLAARLWRPVGGGPVPAVLEYIPYRRRDRTRLRDEGMHPHFARAGYAALRVDMRGSGDSGGTMADEYTEQEIQDGADVIAWIAAQEWCDGAVGMFGKSWGAYSAFQVAALRPPALRAIAPVMGTDDRWLEDIHFYGGCLAADNFWWGVIMQLYNAMPPDPEIAGPNWRALWKTRLEAMSFWPAQWLAHQSRDEMWHRGSISGNYGDVTVPVYYFGGWADLYRDTPFRIARHLSGPVKVLMGPWAHLYPHEGVPGPQVDYLAEVTRFWDHWLKGTDTGLMDEPPLRFWIEGRDDPWVQAPSWPAPEAEMQDWALNAGALARQAKPGPEMHICSPQSFGAAGGDMMSFGLPGDLPGDCRADAGGALCFAGPVLEAPVDLLGPAHLSLHLRVDQPQAMVAVLLVDVAPDGAQRLISRGFCNLSHRHGAEAPQPVTPGEEMAVTVPLHATGYRVAAGHRLMVQIASAYWPILWPMPAPVTLSLRAGASHLSLPVRLGGTSPAPRPLPAPPPPPARAVTTLRDGRLERTCQTDLTTGRVTERVFIDGGVFGPIGEIRLDDTGTELGDISERVYSVHPDDPLSAEARMDQTCLFRRGDWRIRIRTRARMTATAEAFHLTASTTCWEGETEFHHVAWDHTIPRRGM